MPTTPYRILDPASPREEFRNQCALAVMAKAPRAGKVKTRLAPPLTLEESAALNICFLRDTTRNIAEVAAAGQARGLICYTPIGDEAAFDNILPADFTLIPQRGEGFGNRLLAAAEDILACGFASVCLIDSDSPTIPAIALQTAVDALAEHGDRIVLGGSEDGGYYLIGLKHAHPEPFQHIAWSTSIVFEQTLERCREAALAVLPLPMWYDVDDAKTLSILEDELLENIRPPFAEHYNFPGYDAISTRDFLRARRTQIADNISSDTDEPFTDEVIA